MKPEISKKPSALVEYKTIDTLAFIEKIFKESEIEGLSGREFAQVVNHLKRLHQSQMNFGK